jgi:hypothetical protein
MSKSRLVRKLNAFLPPPICGIEHKVAEHADAPQLRPF